MSLNCCDATCVRLPSFACKGTHSQLYVADRFKHGSRRRLEQQRNFHVHYIYCFTPQALQQAIHNRRVYRNCTGYCSAYVGVRVVEARELHPCDRQIRR